MLFFILFTLVASSDIDKSDRDSSNIMLTVNLYMLVEGNNTLRIDFKLNSESSIVSPASLEKKYLSTIKKELSIT